MNKTLVVTKARHKGVVIEALYVCVSSNPGRLQGAGLQIVPHFITSRHQTPTFLRNLRYVLLLRLVQRNWWILRYRYTSVWIWAEACMI